MSANIENAGNSKKVEMKRNISLHLCFGYSTTRSCFWNFEKKIGCTNKEKPVCTGFVVLRGIRLKNKENEK